MEAFYLCKRIAEDKSLYLEFAHIKMKLSLAEHSTARLVKTCQLDFTVNCFVWYMPCLIPIKDEKIELLSALPGTLEMMISFRIAEI